MKKLYCVILTALIVSSLFGQTERSLPVAREVAGRFRFFSAETGAPLSADSWDETEAFINGYAKVSLNRKWGFVDLSGKVAITPRFQALRPFANGLAAAMLGGKWGFINDKGATVIPFQYDIAYDFRETVTAVYRNNRWSLIDRKGTLVKALDVEVFWGFKNGVAKITRKGRNGTMNTQGEILSLDPPATASASATGNTTRLARANSVQVGTCPGNVDFEYGNFWSWYCYTGTVAAVANTNVVTVGPSIPIVNRHTIVPTTTPSLLDPYGLFPINTPNGSSFCVRLGNDINGAEAERMTYQINVPANSPNASITYRYAVVFQDPGHQTWEQPRFSAKVLDIATNTYLPCASYEYIATSSIPGFFNSPINDSIKCKDWASVYINLSKYQGRSLLLEFTTADCTRGGHWGYAYFDMGECDIAATAQYTCNPNQVILTAPPGFPTYKWYNSNYTASLGTNPVLTLSQAQATGGTLHVEVTPYNGFGCADTLHVSYTASFPTANAGPDKPLCTGSAIQIGTAAVPGSIYAWTPKAYLSDSTLAMPVANPPGNATFTVTVTDTTTGCVVQDSMVVTLNPKPAASFTSPPPQCLSGNSFSFTNTSTISSGTLSYAWDFGDGNSSTQTNPSHTFAAAGIYRVKLVATSNNGCKDSVTNFAVTVLGNPPVRTINDQAICRGNTIQLQTTGASTYTWTPAAGLSCTNCSSPVVTPLNNATYIVRGLDSYGCPGSDTVTITVHQPIQVDASPDAAMCQQQSVNLQASGAASYLWSPAQGLSSTTIANPVANPTSTTRYQVIGFDGNNCFTDTSYVNITVNPKPLIDLGPDLTLSTGTVQPLTSIYQNGPIVSWQWTPATDLSCANCPDPSATVKKDITYRVNIQNAYGCVATDSINIRTFCEGSQVFIPNAFTPDGDGVNDILMVRAKGIESVKSFRIFTRWGELVFEKKNFQPNDPASGWDGKIRGVVAPAEVYVYTAEVICSNLQTYLIKGNTSILK